MLLAQLAEFTFPNFPTTTEGWIFEVVGIIASLFVFLSFFWSNEKKTRIVNMVGCVVFVIYALLIGSLSVMIMNSACLVLHIVKLVQMRKRSQNGSSQTPDEAAENEQMQQQESSKDDCPKE